EAVILHSYTAPLMRRLDEINLKKKQEELEKCQVQDRIQ
ncbi:unnamed protein product, partial [marine sediment metagenome]